MATGCFSLSLFLSFSLWGIKHLIEESVIWLGGQAYGLGARHIWFGSQAFGLGAKHLAWEPGIWFGSQACVFAVRFVLDFCKLAFTY
jgi:hypothetical protein